MRVFVLVFASFETMASEHEKKNPTISSGEDDIKPDDLVGRESNSEHEEEEDDEDEDDDDDDDENQPGNSASSGRLSLASFLFGNVDENGQLVDDFFDSVCFFWDKLTINTLTTL